jgi:hypothetical protein
MRVNKTFTVGAAPLNIVTETTTAPVSGEPAIPLSRLFVQMVHGGSGLGNVLTGVPRDVQGSASNAAHLTAELAAATASAPGGSYSDAAGSGNGLAGIDLDARGVWVHGGHQGDTIIVSFDVKV